MPEGEVRWGGGRVGDRTGSEPKVASDEGLGLDAAPAKAASSLEQHNMAFMTPEQWVSLSLSYYQQNRFLESAAAAQTAVYLKPDYAEAYNNVGAAYAALHVWDAAIQADLQAIRLRPDFALARNNLNWALEQKRLAAR